MGMLWNCTQMSAALAEVYLGKVTYVMCKDCIVQGENISENKINKKRRSRRHQRNKICVCVPALKLLPTLYDLMDCSPPGSSVHGILQARILEWGVISFFRASSWPRDWTYVFCIGRQILYHHTRWEAQDMGTSLQFSHLYLFFMEVPSKAPVLVGSKPVASHQSGPGDMWGLRLRLMFPSKSVVLNL